MKKSDDITFKEYVKNVLKVFTSFRFNKDTLIDTLGLFIFIILALASITIPAMLLGFITEVLFPSNTVIHIACVIILVLYIGFWTVFSGYLCNKVDIFINKIFKREEDE